MVGIAVLMGWSSALAGPLDGPTHTIGVRYRHGFVPDGILGHYFYDEGEPGALPYARPKVNANIFGLEYTFSLDTTTVVFWGERIAVPLGAGYWDDRESPPEEPDHVDGDWIAGDGLGAWVVGASYAYDIPIVAPPATPLKVKLGIGGGLGVGPTTGTAQRWHPGTNPDVTDPTCLPTSPAPDRAAKCPADGSLNIPKVAPVVDLSLSPKLLIADHAMLRVDVGIHDFLYWGIAAGGIL